MALTIQASWATSPFEGSDDEPTKGGGQGASEDFRESREGLLTNVQGTQLSHAGTANDVLKYVPMVTGKDGNFEVFGKGKPEIYINNRKVQGDQELAQLNSTDIKNVELITNPGAKYDGSVRSVIRIRTRRPQGEGWSGRVTTQNGFQHYLGTVDRTNLKYRVGGLGIWQPKLNVGITKQWFAIDYQNERKSMGKPYGLVQFQNAIHLPADIWLNLDMQWQFAGNEDNQYLGSASYVNAKLYKAFCKNRFSVSLEANDIFNKSNYNLTLYTNQVKVFQDNRKSDSRTMWLTLQYNFNTTKSRYKGTGAGNAEQNRL